MIIDENKKLVFVRHQKTASSSIIKALRLHPDAPFKNHRELCNYVYTQTGKKYDGHHLPLFELKNINPKVNVNKHNYFKFGFTRNPWERLVSAWKFAFASGKMKQYKETSFCEFIRHHRNAWLGVEMNTLDFCEGCDFIGTFENLQHDFNIVCDKIGIARQQLLHINKTKHKHYTEYYNEETEQIVADKYAKDIEHFGYKFGV